jgi:hypothetical protein
MSNVCNVCKASLYLEEFNSSQLHIYFIQLDFTLLVSLETGVLERTGMNVSLFASVLTNPIEPFASSFRRAFLHKILGSHCADFGRYQ